MSNGEDVQPLRKSYWDRPENRRDNGDMQDPQPRDIAAIQASLDEAKKTRSARVKSAYNRSRFAQEASLASIPQNVSNSENIKSKKTDAQIEYEQLSREERERRFNILVAARVFTRKQAIALPESLDLTMQRGTEDGSRLEEYVVAVTKDELLQWLDGLPDRGWSRLKDWVVRAEALDALRREEAPDADNNRLSEARRERNNRMRSTDVRRVEKKETGPLTKEERIRRINILLRSGLYDRNKDIPDKFKVSMTRTDVDGKLEKYEIEMTREEIEPWLDEEKGGLTEYEKQRLYVIGRKKIDFPEKLEDYLKENPGKTKKDFVEYKHFQAEQKRLADALEIVAIPMIRSVFKGLGKNVKVYLTAANDDIAGGLDIAVELIKGNGQPHKFANGTKMRFVIDVTYARMRQKIKKDLERKRICKEAYDILKGGDAEVPDDLANARAMKLFRTLVETLGGNMSTLTFDEKGPLKKPQDHIPRLICGLDWVSSFEEIAEWVMKGDAFEKDFQDSALAGRITESIKNQLEGLLALTLRDDSGRRDGKEHPNARYLEGIMNALDFGVTKRMARDRSLANIDDLLMPGAEKESYAERLRLAAIAQVEHDKMHGARLRGDSPRDRQPDALMSLGKAREIEKRKPAPVAPGGKPSTMVLIPRPASTMTTKVELEGKVNDQRRLVQNEAQSNEKWLQEQLEEIRKAEEIVEIMELQRRIAETR